MEPEGDTCIWDALDESCGMLDEFCEEHEGCAKRIICLTDGCDTSSSVSVHKVLSSASRFNQTCR